MIEDRNNLPGRCRRADAEGTVRVHRRQFVVGPQPAPAHEHWQECQLADGLCLSHCPELRVATATDADGARWALLGLAVETREQHREEPIEQVARARSSEVPGLYAGWTGRWLLIGNDRVHLDASGLLGCFYGNGADGGAWASSSPSLLAALVGADHPAAIDRRTLRYEAGISWFTPPRSRLAGMSRLLPSQVLAVSSGEIARRPLLPRCGTPRDEQSTLDEVVAALSTSLRRLSKTEGPPLLGLTAGADSRFVLAVARSAGVEVLPFTRMSTRMSLADRLLPPELARACGLAHRLVSGDRPQPDRRKMAREHSAGHVSEGDMEPLLDGSRDSLTGVALGGHGCELFKGFMGLRRLSAAVESPDIQARELARAFGEPESSSAVAGLREWLAWTLETPHEGLDWRERFYLEQREAGWMSSKEQVYDMVTLERFPLLNAARTYSLLLSLPEERRLGSVVQSAVISRLAPDLMAHPFNPPGRHFGRVRGAAIRTRDDPLYLPRVLRHRVTQNLHARLHQRG